MSISVIKNKHGLEIILGKHYYLVDNNGDVWEEGVDYAMGRSWHHLTKASPVQERRIKLISENIRKLSFATESLP